MPNLVQTLEHTPAFVHGGPFANIAHGCNSVAATRSALSLTDYVVTEAGFGSDLGAEKFFNIKCRSAGLTPDAVVLVATVRALKMHGGVARDGLGTEISPPCAEAAPICYAISKTSRVLACRVVVGINRFTSDTDAEIAVLEEVCAEIGTLAIECTHWADGSAGAEALAQAIVEKTEAPNDFDFLYPDDMGLWDKIETIATKIYRAGSVSATDAVRRQLDGFEKRGYGNLPVCMAKTQMSFSADPAVRGAPTGFDVHVREVRLAAGAGFVVAVCGNIMTMPGLPKVPAANSIQLNDQGQIEGLF